MKLVVLGSGTSVPHPLRTAAAFWLETDSGSLLLDCGPDAAHRMAQEEIDWPNLDLIWISHLHLDHCGGLAPLLFGLKWAPATHQRTKPLRIVGCPGIKKLLSALEDVKRYELLNQRFPISVHEVETNDQFELLAGLNAKTFFTPHTNESLALRLSDKAGKTFVYTSDTGYSEGLAGFALGADLLILECSFWRNKPTAKHLELIEAMRLAEIASPKRVLLVHLYPEWDGIDIEGEAKKLWPGSTIAAYDGLRLEF